eukprot:17347-Heterococcus_DN1.PRE.11
MESSTCSQQQRHAAAPCCSSSRTSSVCPLLAAMRRAGLNSGASPTASTSTCPVLQGHATAAPAASSSAAHSALPWLQASTSRLLPSEYM